MKQYTDDEIANLIACVKRVVDPPRRELRSDRGFLRNDVALQSEDGTLKFHVFIRINEKFPENFSIGLEHIPSDEPGSIVLLRYNGPHGEHIFYPHHVHYHIHEAKADAIAAGMKPERHAENAKDYASYPEALAVFLRRINMDEADTHFPGVFQGLLDFGREESR